MKLIRILCALLAAAIMMLPVLAFAEGAVDLDRKGSISITIQTEEGPVPGGDLVLYRVADVVVENGYRFELIAELAGSGISLDDEDISSSLLASRLEQAVADAGIEGTRREIDENGETLFEDLAVGLYLLVQETAAPGFELLDPFLVSVPMNENGVYVYDVDASPKVAPEHEEETPVPSETPGPQETPNPGLPQTGQLNWPIPVMIVLGAVLLVCGIVVIRSARVREK